MREELVTIELSDIVFRFQAHLTSIAFRSAKSAITNGTIEIWVYEIKTDKEEAEDGEEKEDINVSEHVHLVIVSRS